MHVWCACVDCSLTEMREFAAILSSEETAHSQRFRSDQGRDRHIVQHGMLRSLLAGYLGCGPQQVDIRTSSHGKPYLADQDGEASMQFSLSHSGAYAAFAFSRYNSIGVDIEEVRGIQEMEGIVAQHFTPREKAGMLACPEVQRLILFYRFWTRKKAVLKVQGEGLLKTIDCVNVATCECSMPLKIGVSGEATAEEFLSRNIKRSEGFSTAVAVTMPIGSASVQLYLK